MLVVILPFFYIVYAYNISYSLFRSSENIQQPLATTIYDRNGQPVSKLYDEYRNYVKIEEIPETVIKSFLAAEDSSFYMHTGFDLAGIARALFTDIISFELRQGGSTITQQLAKQIFAGKEKSIKRKLVELFLAREFEKKFSKDQILEMYLNQIYLGHGVYGISAAAEFYFRKTLADIDIIEASIIAGLPSAPEKFSPLKNPVSAHDRSLGILFNLISSGYIDKKNAAEKFNSFWEKYSDRIKTEFPEAGIRKEDSQESQWFIEQIRRDLISMYGEQTVYRGGLKVYTTLDIYRDDETLVDFRPASLPRRIPQATPGTLRNQALEPPGNRFRGRSRGRTVTIGHCGLAPGPRHSVERALAVPPAAHQSADRSGGRLDGHEGCLQTHSIEARLRSFDSRRCSNAIDRDTPIMPHIDGIQIGFQNLALGVLSLEHEGGAGLPELSPPCPVVVEEEPPRELLRDRAPPLANSSPPQVRHGGAYHGPQIDPRMAKEAPILRRQDRMDDRLRNLVQGNPDLRASSGPLDGRDLCASGVQVDCRKMLLAKVQQRIGPPGPDQAHGAHYEETDHAEH